MKFSIVICSVDDEKFSALQDNLEDRFAGSRFELLRIPDAKSMCEGYQRGLASSSGEFVIFCHDDIELLEDDVPEKLESCFQHFDVVGVAGTDLLCGPKWTDAGPPHLFGQVANPSDNGFTACIYGAHGRQVGGMQALDGVFQAWRRPAIEQIGWDTATFDGFHLYDLDSTFRAYQAGMRLGVACDLGVLHQSSGSYDEEWRGHAERFTEKHGGSFAPAPKVIRWQYALAEVRTKLGARNLMRPEYWDR